MNSRFICSLLWLCSVVYAYAQTESVPDSCKQTAQEEKDSLSTPLVSPIPAVTTSTPFPMYGLTPFDYGFSTWELHKGLNASIGLNLTFSPSRFAPSGVGFGQDAAFMYAVPLSKRFSVAGGLYASHMGWDFINYKDVGIAGIIGFKATERISIYAYGNKSLMPRRNPFYYPYPAFNPDKIGGMVHFKLNESSSISVGIEGRKYNY